MTERIAHESEEVEIVAVTDGPRLDDVRALLRRYREALARDEAGAAAMAVQRFDDEVAALPGDYAPPGGVLLAALLDGTVVGCIALRPLEDGAGEVKRLFVDERQRGMSLGHKLIDALIDHARAMGYTRLCLDTLPFMRSAVRLYRSFDFEEVASYTSRHAPGARFFARRLDDA